MKLIFDKKRKLPPGKYWGYTVILTSPIPSKTSSLEIHKEARGLKDDEQVIRFVLARMNERGPLIQAYPGFYSATATLLAHRVDEFLGDCRSFVLCHYLDILAHLFAPADRLEEQNIVQLPGSPPLQFHSILTRIRRSIVALHPARLEEILVVEEPSVFWTPFVSEIFRGLEYLSKLFFPEERANVCSQDVCRFSFPFLRTRCNGNCRAMGV